MKVTTSTSVGIVRGGEGFDALLNLDGVAGAYSKQAEDSGRTETLRASVTSSLLDEDGPTFQTSESKCIELTSPTFNRPAPLVSTQYA